MENVTNTISNTINIIENMASRREVSDDQLNYFLVSFLNKAKFHRTPYMMHFQGIYRARAESFNSIEDACAEFAHVEKLSYPPDEFAKASRCNRHGYSVFYGSNENGVPIFETRPEIGQYVVVTGFKPRKKGTFDILLPIIGVKQIRENLSLRDPSDSMVNILSEDMHYKENSDLVSLEIDNHIAKWFSTPANESNKHIYRLTTAFFQILTNNVKYDDDEVHALIYPSVESDITGYNIAIKKKVVDSGLQVQRATIYQVIEKKFKEYALQPLREIDKIEESGKITWRELISKEIFRLSPDASTLSFKGNEIFGL